MTRTTEIVTLVTAKGVSIRIDRDKLGAMSKAKVGELLSAADHKRDLAVIQVKGYLQYLKDKIAQFEADIPLTGTEMLADHSLVIQHMQEEMDLASQQLQEMSNG